MNKKNYTLIGIVGFFMLITVAGLVYKKRFYNTTTRSSTFKVVKSSYTYRTNRILKYDVHGIDVSHHQGNIDWSKVEHPDEFKTIDFVFIRATAGTIKDKKFKKNWKNAKAHDFLVGAYHYYWSNINSTVQAKKFISVVDLKVGDLPPVLDIERLPKIQSKANWRKGLKNWIHLVEQEYGVKPIIYTGESFYKSHLRVDSYFKNYPHLWIANYNKVNAPNHNWNFWQYTDKVKITGISELVDMNVFKGSIEDLNQLIKK